MRTARALPLAVVALGLLAGGCQLINFGIAAFETHP